MERQEILYLILGVALGAIFTSILFLRAPVVSERAYNLGLREKTHQTDEVRNMENIKTSKY